MFIYIVYSLANNVNEEAIKKSMDDYRKTNQKLILKNRAKQVCVCARVHNTYNIMNSWYVYVMCACERESIHPETC